jgi:hypothetical protein
MTGGMPADTRAGEYSWTAEFGKVTKPIGGSPWPPAMPWEDYARLNRRFKGHLFAATGKRIRRLPTRTHLQKPIS